MKTILICDNEPAIRMNLKTMLNDIGFEDVLVCGDGKRAVEMTLARFPDMVILGVDTAGMDGVTAADEIRKKLKIPVVLLTGTYDPTTAKRATACGVAAFLTKPLRQQDLLPTIDIALAHTYEVEDLKEKIEDLKETIENRKIIEKAKGVLMAQEGLSEASAYRSMQKLAMDNRKTLRQVSNGILKGVLQV